jgi:hypothetical protein
MAERTTSLAHDISIKEKVIVSGRSRGASNVPSSGKHAAHVRKSAY